MYLVMAVLSFALLYLEGLNFVNDYYECDAQCVLLLAFLHVYLACLGERVTF